MSFHRLSTVLSRKLWPCCRVVFGFHLQSSLLFLLFCLLKTDGDAAKLPAKGVRRMLKGTH